MDVRTLLAGVLGVAVGLLLVAYPGAVIRAQTAGRLPDDRGGEYGTGSPTPGRWRRLVQALGVVFVAGGLYFAVTVLG